ncbi:PilN domain-containing protein [Methylomonas sp. SURF-2]|uniref:PilN domain-containing protein n=1 Tax=Methylomonas subterranea TaxID=2952225 RepID=A0ABT1THW0_9GAMM|nr:PilN domain-containing protein [Methylomonas sp. SURF-2]MCQ8105038.1 PilN domain-containing protein [Methylomonas sp. SURF-2]
MNLDTTIDFDVKKFFNWWSGELAFLVPKGLRQRLRQRHGSAVFTPTAQGFEVRLVDDEENLILQCHIDLNQTNSFQQLKTQYPALEKADFVLRLPTELALHKLLYLPMAAQENLRQVVGFELDRYTPFNAEQVYFALVPLGATEYAQLRVLLIAAPKLGVDEALTNLTLLGAKPHKVDYAPVAAEFSHVHNAYNLLPERFRHQESGWSRSLQWLPGVGLALLMLAAMALPVWREGQAVDSLQTRIRQLQKQNRVVDEQQGEIDALRLETQKLIDIKQQSPALLAVLNELSRLLNEDTWLTNLHFSENQMQIQGQSPAASALISMLESSDFFSAVSFVSPLTQDKTTGRERFQISMTVSMPPAGPDEPNEEAVDRDATPAPENQPGEQEPLESGGEVGNE